MKIKSFRHGSRSTSKGKIVKSCPTCGGVIILKMSDHYNMVAWCDNCGNMKDEHRLPGGLSLHQWDKGRR
jgi:ssDNA-binding Zn-finger/Zn-ribbon topoisomerase 1